MINNQELEWLLWLGHVHKQEPYEDFAKRNSKLEIQSEALCVAKMILRARCPWHTGIYVDKTEGTRLKAFA